MLLRRVTAQCPQSLVEFYQDVRDQPASEPVGRLMLNLLQALEEETSSQFVWAATVGTDLLLLQKDDRRAPALAVVQAKTRWYFIEAPLPKDQEPWPEAWVKGHTDSVSQAVGMLEKAVSWHLRD